MSMIDDIKNIKLVSIKVRTTNNLIKIFGGIPVSSKGNKNIKRYENGQSNYQMNTDIGKENDHTIIKCLNGIKIVIDKDNINDSIMSDDELSKVAEKLKEEIIVKSNSELEYIKKNFTKLNGECLKNIIESNKEEVCEKNKSMNENNNESNN